MNKFDVQNSKNMTFHSTMCLLKNLHESTEGWNFVSNDQNISGKNFRSDVPHLQVTDY